MFAKGDAQPAASMAGRVHIGNPAARSIPRSFIGGEEAGFSPWRNASAPLGGPPITSIQATTP